MPSKQQSHILTGESALMDPAQAIVLRQIVGLPHSCIIPIVEIGKNIPKPSTAQVGQFILLFQVGE
jgi:hypothetical protein